MYTTLHYTTPPLTNKGRSMLAEFPPIYVCSVAIVPHLEDVEPYCKVHRLKRRMKHLSWLHLYHWWDTSWHSAVSTWQCSCPVALMIVTFAICNQETIIERKQSRRSQLHKCFGCGTYGEKYFHQIGCSVGLQGTILWNLFWCLSSWKIIVSVWKPTL